MKPKQLTALFLALIMIFAVSAQAAPVTEEPDLTINAKAAFLVETTTGQVLYEYHADDKLYPASTTKLMLSLIHISAGIDHPFGLPGWFVTASSRVGARFHGLLHRPKHLPGFLQSGGAAVQINHPIPLLFYWAFW